MVLCLVFPNIELVCRMMEVYMCGDCVLVFLTCIVVYKNFGIYLGMANVTVRL